MNNRFNAMIFGVFSILAGAGLASGANAQFTAALSTRPIAIDIAPQPLDSALSELAQQADVGLAFYSNLGHGLQARRLVGTFTPQRAFQELLADTPLRADFVDARRVVIREAGSPSKDEGPDSTPAGQATRLAAADGAGAATSDSSEPNAIDSRVESRTNSQLEEEETNQQHIQEIVVTGTHIRGVQPTSPVLQLTQAQIELAAQTNLGEAIRSLPQSFSGGQNPGVGLGAGTSQGSSSSNQNLTSGSSINLRGLGPDATLTLLNGRRFPYDGYNQAIDISVIPVSALERVEVLLDGASAIYGSDAVAGVANIILKKDYDGISVSGGYGAATSGGAEETTASAVGGMKWDTGGYMLAGSFQHDTHLRSDQRTYTEYMPVENYLFPAINQKSILFSGHQKLVERVELGLDALYSRRDTSLLGNYGAYIEEDKINSSTYLLSPTLHATLPGSWSLIVNGSFGRNDAHVFNSQTPVGSPADHVIACFCNKAKSAEVDADGPVLQLPAGEARVSIGSGVRSNTLDRPYYDVTSGMASPTEHGVQRSYYGFLETYVPIVSPDLSIPLVSRLTFDGAVRYENYTDFGHIVTPKVGLTWAPLTDATFKLNWGRSFKAPTLDQLHTLAQVYLFPASYFGAGGSNPAATVLLASGGNTALQPERAETFTATLDVHPRWVPDLHIETGYFHVKYSSRVLFPVSSPFAALTDPTAASAVINSPSAAQQQQLIAEAAPDQFYNFSGGAYDPANTIAGVNDIFMNTARQEVDGIDLSINYRRTFVGGTLSPSLYATWMEGWQKSIESSPQFATIGSIFHPPHVRARGGLTWERNYLTLSSFINYTGRLVDPRITPSAVGAAQTTVDGVALYRTGSSSALGQLDVSFYVKNIFNRRPPYLQPIPDFYPNYDSTNYSPIGRVVGFTLTKRW